jgi:1-acyl-sn-glycerol-3-phosphate acyltransferase
LLVISLNTIVLTILLCILAIGKFLAPTEAIRSGMRHVLAVIGETWIAINNALLSLYKHPVWDIRIPDNLDPKGCFLVSCNHQSWVDILVMQRCFNRRLPFFRFFIKSQLIWVPFLGVAWWALDMPFVRRHSKDRLVKQPGLKGRDLEIARQACEKFKDIPVAITNFPEGTRFSTAKRDRRGTPPYQNLLQPRIGGLGQALYALSNELDALIDVTIVYPQTRAGGTAPSFWQLLSGEIPEIIVRAQRREIPPELLGRNFKTDPTFRAELQAWVNALWQEKDELISETLERHKVSENASHQGDTNPE